MRKIYGFIQKAFGGLKDRLKAVDNLTKAINNGELVVDRKNLEIKNNDKEETVKDEKK